LNVDCVTCKGDRELNEDSLVINEEIALYGVADGVSSLVPFKSEENLTGGYIASNEVSSYFKALDKPTNLFDDLSIINKKLGSLMKEYNIDTLKKEQLWGTALALVKVSETGKVQKV